MERGKPLSFLSLSSSPAPNYCTVAAAACYWTDRRQNGVMRLSRRRSGSASCGNIKLPAHFKASRVVIGENSPSGRPAPPPPPPSGFTRLETQDAEEMKR